MISLFLICALVALTSSALLLGRLVQETAVLERYRGRAPWLDALLPATSRCAEEALGASCGVEGWLASSYLRREDGVRETRASLLDALATTAPHSDHTAWERRVRAVYRMREAFGLTEEDLTSALDMLAQEAQGREVLGRRVARVQRLREGELVDRRRMSPLGRGTTVDRPLGFVLHDEAGEVLLRPRVLCR